MSKLEKMLANNGSNMRESMGAQSGPVVQGRSGPPERLKGIKGRSDVATIPLSKLERDPEQPREEFDLLELDRLADSLKAHGQIQPIAAWWDEEASVYRIAAGERRWRAARIAGMEAITVSILPARPESGHLLVLQLVENLHRSDLRPLELARAFRKAIDANGWTASRLAVELAQTETVISKALSLLNLPTEVQAHVEAGELSRATAYEVTKLRDPAQQIEVATEAVAKGLKRDEVSAAVKARNGSAPGRAGVYRFRVGAGTISVAGVESREAALDLVRELAGQAEAGEGADVQQAA
jgi:ParB/RepB/Spo0J family partition protein